ncbi:RNA polymerase II transcription factor SIII subunit A-domain-containing protein [Jackrogersella minutella]|nr:RNA polymerase II transcription factor SIII subunit A-domain-containing protein [Jackrogersella minutella]
MVKTLVELCTAVCIKNVREIYDVGGAPYSILRPILLKVEDPAQLQQLEEQSPHLLGDTVECWQRLINRDFTHLVKKCRFEPRNPALWSKIYQKYKTLEIEQKKAALAKLNNGFKNIKKEKQAKAVKAMTFDAKVHGKIPNQRKVGPGGKREGSVAVNLGALTWGGGTRTKATSAHGIMQKARREAAEIGRRKKLSTPTGQLAVRQGQIVRAPRGMVEEHRTKTLPAARSNPIVPPMRGNEQRWDREQKEREARLLKAKNGSTTKGATIVSDEDLLAQDEFNDSDSDQEGGGLNAEYLEEDLFDEKPSSAKTSSSLPPASSSTSKPGHTLTGLAKMKLGRSWKDRPTRLEPIETHAPKSASKPMASSPPPRHSMPSSQLSPLSPPAGGADFKPKPMLAGQKRKQPSVFMQPRPKARRMS